MTTLEELEAKLSDHERRIKALEEESGIGPEEEGGDYT
mgnify:CR=1 FL=1